VIGDTIVALATAAGPAARAALRISGPRAFEVAALAFTSPLTRVRAQVDGEVRVRGRAFPARALTMVGPASFTGEDVVELHVPGSPVLARLLEERLLEAGATTGLRAALPGEFTARACENGRLDLAQAEGLLLLLHAQDQRQADAALQWLNGGLADAAGAVRGRLQDLLAMLEVGFDFDEMDTGAVATELWRDPLRPVLQQLDELLGELPVQAPGGELLLVGRANAGKSSLVNALAGDAGEAGALVADVAGTTRDLLRVEVAPGVHLWDAPGDLDQPGAADRAALELRERLAGRAAGLLVVIDSTDPRISPMALRSPLPWFGAVFTKRDLVAAPPSLDEAARARTPSGRVFVTSATGLQGISELRSFLSRHAGGVGADAGGPLRAALQRCREAVAGAIEVADLQPEVAAAELQAALRALDGIGGDHSAEHLLDRIYGRFCLGK